jgi:disulfide bond formation protein DsbB
MVCCLRKGKMDMLRMMRKSFLFTLVGLLALVTVFPALAWARWLPFDKSPTGTGPGRGVQHAELDAFERSPGVGFHSLNSFGNQYWHQGSPGILGAPEGDDRFGRALATGDFDGDGSDDLAVGVPNEDVAGHPNAGAVNVLYGTGNGLSAAGDQYWHQNRPGILGELEDDDKFGAVLAAGDFDGDGFDDLALGAPGEDVAGHPNAGAVNVLYGTGNGLSAARDQVWHQGSPGILGAPEDLDGFGWALATGDFDGNGFDDLALGVPWEHVAGHSNAGAVNVLYGTGNGLGAAGNQYWHQGSPGVLGVVEVNDEFGWETLAAGDFDGDGFDDLAVGVRFEDVAGEPKAGAVNVLYGTGNGLSAAGNQYWHQGSPGITGVVEEGDHFGRALAAGDFDGDGFDDLAVGVPEEDRGGFIDPGQVQVLYGTGNGLSAAWNQVWHQDSPWIGGAREHDDHFGRALAARDFDGDGFDDLAVGVPGETVADFTRGGSVNVLYGTGGGLSAAWNQAWGQGSIGIAGELEDDDKFGAVLAAGDFDGDGFDDLAVGVPWEDVAGHSDAGAVNVLYGAP